MLKFIKNTLFVGFSQIVLLLSGIATGILLPKIMTVDSYGSYKLYTLYLSYVGLFHFGFIDGIYLKYGGVNYDDLDRRLFRMYSKYLFLIESFFTIVAFGLSLSLKEETYRFVFGFLAITIFTSNVLSYYQYISQITKRFKEYSYRNIIRAISTILIVVLAYIALKSNLINVFTYKHYIALLTFVNIMLVIWYTITYRELIIGKSGSVSLNMSDVKEMHFLGLPLMVSNLIISLIFALDRQFVSILFAKNEFAVYSFAYNMLSIATTVVTAISVVLYPMLKEMKKERIASSYNESIAVLNIFIFFAMIFYFPFCDFIQWFLPNYTTSIPIFRIIIPGLALSSTTNIIIYNYYKCVDGTKKYFKLSMLIFLLAFLLNTIAYMLFHSTSWISIASIVTLSVWYLLSDNYIKNLFQIDTKRNRFYIILMIVFFYIISFISNNVFGALVYTVVYITVTGLLYRNIIYSYYIRVKASLRKQ